ncbi:MAG TPA: hypothetical protein ENI62_03060, partial [Gammaproteobacteria bacterium]|nr:hypothetical protein [Gammaproteobacteria bacterium]
LSQENWSDEAETGDGVLSQPSVDDAAVSMAEATAEESPLMSIAEMERELIDRTLKATHWHKGHACEILGISRPRLERKVKLYHLHR